MTKDTDNRSGDGSAASMVAIAPSTDGEPAVKASSDEIDESTLVVTTGAGVHMVQRLQIGLAGLVVVLLLVALANVVTDQLREQGAGAPEETEKPEKTDGGGQEQSDPLVDAGVVPDVTTDGQKGGQGGKKAGGAGTAKPIGPPDQGIEGQPAIDGKAGSISTGSANGDGNSPGRAKRDGP